MYLPTMIDHWPKEWLGEMLGENVANDALGAKVAAVPVVRAANLGTLKDPDNQVSLAGCPLGLRWYSFIIRNEVF